MLLVAGYLYRKGSRFQAFGYSLTCKDTLLECGIFYFRIPFVFCRSAIVYLGMYTVFLLHFCGTKLHNFASPLNQNCRKFRLFKSYFLPSTIQSYQVRILQQSFILYIILINLKQQFLICSPTSLYCTLLTAHSLIYFICLLRPDLIFIFSFQFSLLSNPLFPPRVP